MAVPATLPANSYRCTVPEEDTILVPSGAALGLCMADEPPGLTVAVMGAASTFGRGLYEFHGVTYQPATLDGRPAQRVTGTVRDGRHMVGVLVPGSDVGYWVVSPDRARAETLVAEAHLVDVDHAGCPTRPARRYAAPPARPGATETMVPGVPVELTACRYDEAGLLLQSNRLAGPKVAALVRHLNALPPGYQKPAPRWATDCGKHVVEPVVFTFRYAEGSPLDVVMHMRGCDRLGASNGAVHGKFTPEFLKFVRFGYVQHPSYWMGWLEE